jgi:hypothetical protein
VIYDSEEGFDFRFAKEKGMFGTGIYFALDPAYSHLYAYRVNGTQNVYQMLISLVNTGQSKSYTKATSETSELKLPPLIEGKPKERYDSVHNNFQGHYIVYDNNKVYPGYLITYTD